MYDVAPADGWWWLISWLPQICCPCLSRMIFCILDGLKVQELNTLEKTTRISGHAGFDRDSWFSRSAPDLRKEFQKCLLQLFLSLRCWIWYQRMSIVATKFNMIGGTWPLLGICKKANKFWNKDKRTGPLLVKDQCMVLCFHYIGIVYPSVRRPKSSFCKH